MRIEELRVNILVTYCYSSENGLFYYSSLTKVNVRSEIPLKIPNYKHYV